MLRTRITEQYELKMPFVSAGMGFVAMPELTAAVSNTGGLGLLGASPAPPDVLENMIRATKTLTPYRFGVDLIIADISTKPTTTDDHIEVCVNENVKLVVFHWDMPKKEWVKQLKESGAKIWIQIESVDKARQAIEIGADAIIAQGSEAGGHNRSSNGLFSIVPNIVDAIAPVPVIAAGGIADGRTVAAALALGADAVCVGTRLIASREAHAHEEYKRRIISSAAEDIARTAIFGLEWPDQPMRVIRNRVVAEWAGRDDRTPSSPGKTDVIGKTIISGHEYIMHKFSAMLPTPETTGDFEEMCMPAGESAGLVKEIKPASEIVNEMINEAKTIMLERLINMTKNQI